MSKKTLKVLFLYYLPLLAWMGVIFYLSSVPGLKTGAIIPVEIIFRKLAHLFEYALLSFLFWRVFHNVWGVGVFKASIFSFTATVLYAFTDEFHQYFVENRAGRLQDVALDSLGGLLGVILSKNFFAAKS
ncbi:MAG: VanZ family protein [Candidatus Moraniibacteriota bacterium]